MRLGIPYAYVEVDDDGKVVHVCPICDARIPESTDRDGEMTTNNYAAHYADEHEREDTA